MRQMPTLAMHNVCSPSQVQRSFACMKLAWHASCRESQLPLWLHVLTLTELAMQRLHVAERTSALYLGVSCAGVQQPPVTVVDQHV